MKYLCLAYGDEKDWKKLPKREQDELLAQDTKIRERGALMGAVESDVTTVRAWEGVPRVADGPQGRLEVPLAGFSIIEADDVEEVVRLVADTPCARAHGAIEIRPIMMLNRD
ncbi:MAG TPA: YciI family protein [Gammaproteobacteria bacterium]